MTDFRNSIKRQRLFMTRNESGITRRTALAQAGLAMGAALTANRSAGAEARHTPPPAPARTEFVFCLNMATIRGQKLGLMREIDVASQAGYQGVELWIDVIQQYVQDGGSVRDARTKMRDLGLRVEGAIGFPAWIVDDEAKRNQGMEQAKRDMDLIAQLGGTRLAAPPVGATQEPGLELGRAAERYRDLLDLGDRMGVCPQLEIWGASANLHQLGQAAQVAIQSGHPKACVLADVFHLYKGGSDWRGLRLLSSYAIQVFHMNDYPAEPVRDKINDSYRIFPGDGVAPITQIVRDLDATGGRKVLSLELFNRDYYQQDPLEVAKKGLAKMKQVVRQALA